MGAIRFFKLGNKHRFFIWFLFFAFHTEIQIHAHTRKRKKKKSRNSLRKQKLESDKCLYFAGENCGQTRR